MSSRRGIVPVLPTIFTLGNLLCGFLAIAKTVDALQLSGGEGPLDPLFSEKMIDAAHLVLLAMVFDALDGRIARITKQTSAFGAQLDSLADVVTFGVTPAIMAKVVYEHGMASLDIAYWPKLVTLLAMIYLAGAVLRLARFTSVTEEDPASHETFEGLPSPAAAGVILSLVLFIFDGRNELPLNLEPSTADSLALALLHGLPGIACVLGLLMISKLPYVHVVQRYVGNRARATAFVPITLVALFMIMFHEWSLLLVSATYVLGGVVLAVRAKIRGQSVLEGLPEPWGEGDAEEHAPTNGHGKRRS